MGNITKLFAYVGLVGAIGLTIFDFKTSIDGIRQIMPQANDDVLVIGMPLLFAMLALCFNATSAYMFRMHVERGFSSFPSTVTFSAWVFFLSYDAISSLIGILSTYTTQRIYSLSSAVHAFQSLDTLAAFFVLIMAALLALGPFLCTLFSDLTQNA